MSAQGVGIWGVDAASETRKGVAVVDAALSTGRKAWGRLGRNGDGSRPWDGTGDGHDDD